MARRRSAARAVAGQRSQLACGPRGSGNNVDQGKRIAGPVRARLKEAGPCAMWAERGPAGRPVTVHPVRIALVSPYSWTYPGGVTRHIEALSAELHALGHDARILTPSDPDDRRSARLHR